MADRKPRPSEIYFGSTEIEEPTTPPKDQVEETRPDGVSLKFLTKALRGRRPDDDIVAAATGSGRSMFAGWPEKVNGGLNGTYPVYLHMLKGGQAVDEVLNHPRFPQRQRIHREKLALIALQLSAQPQDDAQFKALSEYSSFLTCAALREVPPEEFAERMAGVRLKDAKAYVRALKKVGPKVTLEAGAPNPEPTPVPEKPRKVPEKTTEPSNAPSEAPESPPVWEPASNLPSANPPAPSSHPTAAPKKVHAATDERVKSPVTRLRVTVFDEAGKHPVSWPLTPAQAKALLAVDPKRFRSPAGYLEALANALAPPVISGVQVIKKGTR